MSAQGVDDRMINVHYDDDDDDDDDDDLHWHHQTDPCNTMGWITAIVMFHSF